ncbi:NADPH-dependent F420 reductase [Kutzneria sp. 744]|uniref:NADPH-dependent F420 reductase n=1 Tax=Kutzneria sp. (strain 744) TaxID=345341 RepID=UPI0003EEDDCC|nr:NAD(P)-binding domain-containing protein [Kutzneria sp. 744]EWM10079.1 oxidoreductase [Kutzneria sp. 744]
MTRIAVLGTGRVGSALGAKLGAKGHYVTFGSRAPETVRGRWVDPEVRFTTTVDAVRDAAVVVNTTPGTTTLELLTPLREELAGRVLVDVANATERAPDGTTRLLYPESSLGEHLQQALPDTHVVKTLNTMLFLLMTNPADADTANPPTAFLSGDDDTAKTVTRGLLHDLGWPDEWIEDLGGIASARGPESFMLYVPFLARKHGMAPFGLSLAVPR